MIQFELNRPLNIFFNNTLAYIDEAFLPRSRYIVDKDRMIALGERDSLVLSFSDRGIETIETREEPIQGDEWILFEEDSIESELMKYVYTLFRMWQQIPPYASAHMHKVLLRKLNKELLFYDLHISEQSETLAIEYGGECVRLEDALQVVMQRNAGKSEQLEIRIDYEEAERLRGLGQHEEALPFYLRAIEREEKNSTFYTLASFGLGEVYYFMDDMEKTVKTYLRCNAKLLQEETELYRRLGHAFLDNRMKKHTDYIKTYLKCLQSIPYANRHKEEQNEAIQYIGEMFEEYDATCIEVGKKQYQTFAEKIKA